MENGIFETIEDARPEIFSYLEGYFNLRRLHLSLVYKCPIESGFELRTKNEGGKRQFIVQNKLTISNLLSYLEVNRRKL